MQLAKESLTKAGEVKQSRHLLKLNLISRFGETEKRHREREQPAAGDHAVGVGHRPVAGV